MSLFSRFFGKTESRDSRGGELVANPGIEHPLGLQVLFSEPCLLDPDHLAAAFREYHPSMAGVRCELDPTLSLTGKVLGMIGWGKHVVRCIGLDLPMPAVAVEACIGPSHYPPELKERARSHKAHLMLYYVGHEISPVEQYAALAATAGVLARWGALVVLNESGHTSFPAAALSGVDTDGDILDLLRTLPLPLLYCGFVKYEVEGIPGVWMRTHGAPLLGLPDFAAHAAGHHEGERYCGIFDHVFGYLRESGAKLAEGHTLQIGQEEFLRVRRPKAGDPFPESGDELLVMEIIGPDEITR